MKYQLFVLAGCPACAAIELFMQDIGLEYDRVVLSSPRDATDVLVILSESDPRCPALCFGETCATGLAACLELLRQCQSGWTPLPCLEFSGKEKELADGILSDRMLLARNEQAFSRALGDVRDAIQEWNNSVSSSKFRFGLLVPYLDLRLADRLSGGKFKLVSTLGFDKIVMKSMAYRLPISFFSAYLDRLKRGRSWVYWNGSGGLLGGRIMRLYEAGNWGVNWGDATVEGLLS